MSNQHALESLESVGNFYYKKSLRAPTPLSVAFFDPSNIQCIRNAVEQKLEQLTGQCIRVVVNEEFLLTLIGVLEGNLAFSYIPQQGVPLLNDLAIEHETSVQYMSLRQRQLYYKRIINGERLRVFPYGEQTHVSAKGTVKVSPSSYQLGLPWRRNQSAFLKEVLCAGQNSGPCTRPFTHPVRT